MNHTILLQPSEWIIMEKLWEQAPKTITQLYHELKETPGWSKSTVNTLLRRMLKKELIFFEEGGKAKQYFPKIHRDAAAIAETKNLLDRVFQGSVSMMMNTLVRNKHLSDSEIQELYHILEERTDRND